MVQRVRGTGNCNTAARVRAHVFSLRVGIQGLHYRFVLLSSFYCERIDFAQSDLSETAFRKLNFSHPLVVQARPNL